MNDRIRKIEQTYMKETAPQFNVGDTIKVMVRIREGEKERVQPFEGIVTKKSRTGVKSTFTVRKVSYGIGVERTFYLHSPMIEEVKPVQRGKVRRSKLYYLRALKGKAARVKEDRS
jgi:large subunit ribosomal protein L19